MFLLLFMSYVNEKIIISKKWKERSKNDGKKWENKNKAYLRLTT